MKDLYIIGAGGFGREVAWLIERINFDRKEKGISEEWYIKGFIDDNRDKQGDMEGSYNVIGDCVYLNKLADEKEIYAVCAVGAAKVRKKIIKNLNPRIQFPAVIDPSVLISDRAEIGAGSIICGGTIITVDIKIGKHVIINLNCTVGHDVILHDYVTVYPSVNISGNVEVGECSEMGTGMQIIQGKKIGTCSVVGAGAVVVQDIPENCTAVGSPAKPIKYFI